ncbi:MAG: hypothetical protein ACXW2O_06200, partial [Candidatus Aminicenantales bacterium]
QKINDRYLMAVAYARMNRHEEARRLLAEDLKYPQLYSFYISITFFQLGENEEALKGLEKAYDGHAYGLHFIKVHPLLDHVRSDPRFQALLKKMGLDDR